MKIRPIIRLAALATLAALIITTVPWLIGAALAATGNAPVVPPPTPDALLAYVQSYGWLVGGLTVGYVIVKWLLAKNESKHWIAQGRTLAVVTTVVGVVGTAIQAYTSGAPWSGVLVTALLGLLHLADAQVTPASRAGQGGFCRTSAMAVLAAIGVGAVALVLAGGAVMPAAGCAGSQRVDTIRAALVTADSARDGFLAYDRTHEMELVRQAASADDAKAKIVAYQAKRAKIDPLFALVYRSIAAAELLNDDQSVTSMQVAIGGLLDALKPFLGGK